MLYSIFEGEKMIKKATKQNIIDFVSTAKTISEDAKDYFKKKFIDGLENKSKTIYVSDKNDSDLLVAIINQNDYDNFYNLIDANSRIKRWINCRSFIRIKTIRKLYNYYDW